MGLCFVLWPQRNCSRGIWRCTQTSRTYTHIHTHKRTLQDGCQHMRKWVHLALTHACNLNIHFIITHPVTNICTYSLCVACTHTLRDRPHLFMVAISFCLFVRGQNLWWHVEGFNASLFTLVSCEFCLLHLCLVRQDSFTMWISSAHRLAITLWLFCFVLSFSLCVSLLFFFFFIDRLSFVLILFHIWSFAVMFLFHYGHCILRNRGRQSFKFEWCKYDT